MLVLFLIACPKINGLSETFAPAPVKDTWEEPTFAETGLVLEAIDNTILYGVSAKKAVPALLSQQ